jgi:hypothetical protein
VTFTYCPGKENTVYVDNNGKKAVNKKLEAAERDFTAKLKLNQAI